LKKCAALERGMAAAPLPLVWRNLGAGCEKMANNVGGNVVAGR